MILALADSTAVDSRLRASENRESELPCQQLDGTVLVRDARVSIYAADPLLAVLRGVVAAACRLWR